MNWWERLFNNECRTCAVLERQLEIERQRFNLVLDRLDNIRTAPVNHVEEQEAPELKPIKTGRQFVPFAVRQRMVEEQDMKTLDVLKKRHAEINSDEPEPVTKLKTNEELEKELLGTDLGAGGVNNATG